CIANAIVANGVSDWFVTKLLPASLALPEMGIVFLVCMIVFLMLIVIPVAPALIAVLAPAMVTFSQTTGVNVAILILAMGICASNCYLFPLDTVPLITYSTKYYTMTDMPKSTVFIQLALGILVALWLPFAGGLMGW
ncbi:MAG: sodium:sulfate symporter, partial [Eubacterium sp.]